MHDHSHCDHHQPTSFTLAFAVGVTLNSLFVVGEFAAGLISHSMALTADAGHNLGDVLSLIVGWYAIHLATRKPTESRTYGLRRSTILAAVWNSTLLMLVVGAIAWESIQRLQHPIAVTGTTVMAVALVGIFVNGTVAFMFVRGRKGDLNIRGAYLHMLSDALVSAGVVITGLIIRATGLAILDSVASLVIAVLIGTATWRMLRRSIDLALDAVPEGIDPRAVRDYLCGVPGVTEVTDLHIWAMSTTETALTAHIVVPDQARKLELQELSIALLSKFGIDPSTIQVEANPGHPCPLEA